MILAYGISLPAMILIGVVLLLLFGRRLPEIGRSLGRGLVEFKKGLRGVEDEIKQIDVEATSTSPSQQPAHPPTASPARLANGPVTETEPLRPGHVVCPKCSHMMPATSRFCSDCGTPIESPAAKQTQPV